MAKQITLGAGIVKMFALGFRIDSYSLTIDFLCFWVAIEW